MVKKIIILFKRGENRMINPKKLQKQMTKRRQRAQARMKKATWGWKDIEIILKEAEGEAETEYLEAAKNKKGEEQ